MNDISVGIRVLDAQNDEFGQAIIDYQKLVLADLNTWNPIKRRKIAKAKALADARCSAMARLLKVGVATCNEISKEEQQ